MTETCRKCGHTIRHPHLWDKNRITRWVFEGICINCQNKTQDPNPERTQRCGGINYD